LPLRASAEGGVKISDSQQPTSTAQHCRLSKKLARKIEGSLLYKLWAKDARLAPAAPSATLPDSDFNLSEQY